MELSLAQFVNLLLSGSALTFWIAVAVSRGWRRSETRIALRRRIVCRLCQHAYQDGSDPAEPSRCPTCGARNERTRNGRLG